MKMQTFRFVDLFAGLGGFHLALDRLGGQCVFAAEWKEHLRDLYEENFGLRPRLPLAAANHAMRLSSQMDKEPRALRAALYCFQLVVR